MADEHTVTLRPPVWALLLAVLLGGLFYIGGKKIESRTLPPATISVSGEGKVFAAPDIGEVSFGVQTGRQPTAKQALSILRDRMNAALKAVKEQGIEEKDIRTENFWLNPVYDWTEERGQIFRGFEANQSLRVKVRDLDKVSAVLEVATAAGANQAGSVNFTIDDPEAKRSEAREKAINQAKEKALAIAADLGMRLGGIQGFNESGGPWVPPIAMTREAYGKGGAVAMDAALQESVPVPPGEQEIRVVVTLSYELK